MVVKMSAPGRSFGGVADYCLHDPRMPGEAHPPESAERVEWTETRNLATERGRAGGADHGGYSRGVPGSQARLAGGVGDGAEAGEAGVPLFAELGQG